MSALPERCDVVVVGAGITGLTTAFQLARGGADVVLLEAGERVGGVMEGLRADTPEGHWHFETGPNTVIESHPEVMALIEAAGLSGERVEADPAAKKRYIWKQGRLLALPGGPGSLLTTPLLSFRGKARLFAEPLIGKGPEGEQSLADFVHRRLGREILDNAVAPFVSGVYAGDPERLSLRWAMPKLHELEAEHGGLVKGMAAKLRAGKKAKKGAARQAATGAAAPGSASPGSPGSAGAAEPQGPTAGPGQPAPDGGAPKRRRGKAMVTFRDGLDTLPRRLAQEIEHAGGRVLTGSPCQRVLHGDEGFQVEFQGADGGSAVLRAPRVVLTAPADAAARMLETATGGDSAELAEVPYAPVAVGTFGVPLAALDLDDGGEPLDGFGFLVASRDADPGAGELRLLGCLTTSTFFPGRAPEGHAALTCFAGGRTDPDAVALDDDELLALYRRDLQTSLGLDPDRELPVAALRRWPRAIPQYELGHGRFADLRDDLQRRLPGLHLAGNYLDGVSVPDRIRHGTHLARFLLT